MERDDPVRAVRAPREELRRALHLLVAQAARLVPPRPHRVEADDDERLRAVDRLGRLPQPLELVPGPGEAPREACTGCRGCPGSRAAAARGCAGRRPRARAGRAGRGGSRSPLAITSSGSRSSISRPSASIDSGLSLPPEMEVGEVEDACRHSRLRLYSPAHGRDRAESPEIFDDLYLGLRAGGALRKQRRGEPLDDRGAGGARPLAAALDRRKASRSARSPSAPSGSASPSAASSSAAGARPDAR